MGFEFDPFGTGINPIAQSGSFTFDPFASTPTPLTQQEEPDFVSGESFFEQFMDAIGTPQQMLFGTMTSRPGEGIWESMVRGAKTNVSGTDVAKFWNDNEEEATSTDVGVGTALQFVVDPLNFVPAKLAVKLFSPIGKGIKWASGPVGELLGKSETWRKFAGKFAKHAYKNPTEVSQLDDISLFHDRMMNAYEEAITKGLTDPEEVALEATRQWAISKGRPPEWGEKLHRQLWEDKIERHFMTDLRDEMDLHPEGLLKFDPVKPDGTFNVKTNISLDPDWSKVDARKIYEEDTLRELIEVQGWNIESTPGPLGFLDAYRLEPDVGQTIPRQHPGTKTTYYSLNREVSDPGGYKTFRVTLNPQNPLHINTDLLLPSIASENAPRLAIRELLGDDIAETLKQLERADDVEPLIRKLTEFGMDAEESRKVLQHHRPTELLDILGAKIAKENGYDAIVRMGDNYGGPGVPGGEVAMLDDLGEQIKRGALPNIIKELGALPEITRHIPIKIPKEIFASGTAEKLKTIEQRLRDLRAGGNTPALDSVDLSYAKHMKTKYAAKQVLEAHRGSGTIKKGVLDPKHNAMIARKLRILGIDGSNKAYDSLEGLEVGGHIYRSPAAQKHFDDIQAGRISADTPFVSKGEKFFEDSPTALRIFRDFETVKLEHTVQLLRHSVAKYGTDIGPIRDQIVANRRQARSALYKIIKHVESGLMQPDEFVESLNNIVRDFPDIGDAAYLLTNNIEAFNAGQIELKDLIEVSKGARTAEAMGRLSEAVKNYIPEGWVPLNFTRSADPAYQNLIPYFKDQYVDPDAAKHLNAYFEITMNPEAQGGFWELAQKIRDNWVIGTLYAPPGSVATMIKNEIGNYFNNSLAGIYSPITYEKARQIWNLRKSNELIDLWGTQKTGKQIWAEIREMAVLTGGLGGQETRDFMARFMYEPGILRIPGAGKVLKKNAQAYQYLENNARIAHYIHKRFKEGLTPLQARMSVKKYLYDYTDLSDLERKLRVFVPFYAWTKNNLPLQIRSIIENPIRPSYVQTAHLFSLVRDNEASRNIEGYHKTVLPNFVREQVGVPIRVGEDGNPTFFLFGSWIPATEIEALFSKGSAMRKVYSLLAPWLKVPQEQAFNYEMFIDRQIEKYPGETNELFGMPVRRRVIHMLKSLRFMNDFDRMTASLFNEEIDDPAKASAIEAGLRLLFGANTYNVKLEYGEMKRQKKINEIMRTLNYEPGEANQEALMEYLEDLTE